MENDDSALRNTAKAVLRGKLMMIQAYNRKQKKGQVNSLNLHLK